MTIAGIIAEYNPFHNGHALHIEKTRRRTGCDWVVACMGGHFTQRGEPTPFSKWNRARMALACGVDAVFELPALFCMRTADAFALGGVAILDGLGVDALSFGSELDDLDAIAALAALRQNEPEAVSEGIRRGLAQGKSHARARGEAVGAYLGLDGAALDSPNLILAAEYVRAIERLGASIRPVAILREGDYRDETLSAARPSATAVRAAFARGETERAMAAVPEAARPFAVPDAMHPMDDVLLYRLRGMTPGQLAALPDMAEGLEHRVYRLCREAPSREALLDGLKCKRYTRARLSRLLAHAALGIDRALTEAVPLPPYARLIGARPGAEPLLRALSGRTRLPIVTGGAALRGDACFEAECRATDLWALLHDDPASRASDQEYTRRFVR